MTATTSARPRGIGYALLAALLFGASTPFAKALVGQVSPLMLAGLLYAGSGLGLSLWRLLRPLAAEAAEAPLGRSDWPWLFGAILAGGVVAPALLMFGLQATSAADASLLLNLEGVLTASIAWIVFRENVDRRILFGMMAIVFGGVLLTWEPGAGTGLSLGSLLIAGACLGWAIDNNLTRVVSGGDAVQIAALKGLASGGVNISLALWMGSAFPSIEIIGAAAAIGVVGYGISLVLFVFALRHLGTARTGAYFSITPFVGATLALVWLREAPDPMFWIAAALMAIGVWLHVSEHHEHEHEHEALDHEHLHSHDDHHQHEHEIDWDGKEPHSHPHHHEPTRHSHPHYPDLHHRHRH